MKRFWADLSVNIKVMTAISVAAVVALVIGANGLRSLSEASASANEIFEDNVTSVAVLGEVENAITQSRLDLTNHAVYSDATNKAKYEKEFTTDLADVSTTFKNYIATGPAGSATTIQTLETDWAKYVDVARNQLLPLSRANNLAKWQEVRTAQIQPLVTTIKAGLAELGEAERADAAAAAGEARSSYHQSRLESVVVLVIGILAALGLGFVVARGIVRSLRRVTTVCEGLAAGDLTQSTGITSADEPGRMSRALDAAVLRLRETVTTIGDSAVTLASASEELNTVSSQLQSGAGDVAEQAGSASAASEEVNVGVQSIAAGAEQMSASITEIAANAAEAARVANEGMNVAERTTRQVAELGTASAEISDVVKLITTIAEQTNLLALNATIEAARAGELGKGFAVVAGEVKELSQQTAKATEEITARIGAIQASSTSATAAIGEITDVIQRIGDYTTTIASAVEEQTATTGEMSRSVAEAASSSGEVARTVTGVAEVAAATAEGARTTQQAAADLTRLAGDLTNLVGGFRH
ncbi:methyl-accepting chemotaxis protein [Actinoplanes sp. HUAS TT8]|uniref:methyl-accepting chemotaxis protein n=1 Tax=Actinoplanes sp. HUAS TT8 TaxID=3447453 RepID=UPI003F5254E3